MKEFLSKENIDKLKEKADDVKQFCVQNKKYVGSAAVLVGLIIILAIIVSGGDNGKKGADTESEIQISVEDFEFEKDYTDDSKDEIDKLLEQYYAAYVSDDIDKLDKIAYPMSDNEKSYLGAVSQYYEAVTDVKAYTKRGLKKGSFFVSVENNIKFYGVNTAAPTLDFFYIETDKNGKLYINNIYSNFNRTYEEEALDESVLALIKKYTAAEEFSDIQGNVQKAYEEAVNSDADLKTMLQTTLSGVIKQWYATVRIEKATEKPEDEAVVDTETTETPKQDEKKDSDSSENTETDANEPTSDTSNAEEPATDAAQEQPEEQPQTPSEYSVVTKDIVNVRERADAASAALGKLTDGVTLTAYGTEGEWTIISYSAGQNGRAYVKTELLSTVN